MTNPTALKAIAEAATQDDWEADGCEVRTRLDGDVDGDTGRHFVVGGDLIAMTADTEDAEANATFIATFDPPTVLALLSEIEEKDRRIEALVKALEPFGEAGAIVPADVEDFKLVAYVPGGHNAGAFQEMKAKLTAGALRQARSTLRTHPNGE